MKKIIITVLMAGSLLALVGCGNTKATSNSESSSSTAQKKSSKKITQYKIGEDALNNKRIYYRVFDSNGETLGVQTVILDVIIVDHGKIESIQTNDDNNADWKLKDLKGLTDEQVISEAKKRSYNNFLESKKSNNSLQYQKGTPKKLKISAITDSTGNIIQSESLEGGENSYTGNSTESNNSLTAGMTIFSSEGFFKVFNQKYASLSVSASSSNQHYITRYEGQVPTLDSVDEDFIDVSTE